MGASKKHNGQSWEIFGSGEATDIAVRNAKLLDEGEEMISVEEALTRLDDKVEKHSKNIAWLTKYGGGGSGAGAGGGGSVTEATGTLYVNGVLSGNDVIMGDNGLEIILNDVPASVVKSWVVTVNVGAVLIATSSMTRTSNTLYIAANRIAAALVNHHGILRVNASYEDDANAVYGSAAWSGDIYESVVNLYSPNSSTSLDNILSTELVFNYSVGYLGNTAENNYRFTAVFDGPDTSFTYTTDLRVLDTQDHDLRIPLTNMFPEGTVFTDNLNLVGVYTVTATLASIQNSRLNASSLSTVTVASENILISSTLMSPVRATPQLVSTDGNLDIQFTAYVQGMTDFTYEVLLCADKNVIYNSNTASQFSSIASGNGVFGTQVNALIAVSGKSWMVNDDDQEVVLYVRVTSGTRTGSQHYYVKFVPAESSFIEEKQNVLVNKIFDFEARVEDTKKHSFSYSNPDFIYGSQNYPLTSQMETLNGNSLSVIREVGNVKSLRLSNGACAHIHSFRFNNQTGGFNSFFSNNLTSGNQFTLSICFKADYHADDDRTVLFCGFVDTNETVINETTGDAEPNPNYLGMSGGVSIDVHNVYINKEAVCSLSDNTINMVDIVAERTTIPDYNPNTGRIENLVKYVFKVYLNGVLSAIKGPESSVLSFGSDIYLGCRQLAINGTSSYKNLCDCDIYDLKVYDTALTDFDIMTNYINNKARVTTTQAGLPDYSQIDKELRKNFCSRDAENNIDSLLYRNGQYTIDFLLDGTGNNLDQQKLNDYAKALSIPIMLIDVSGASSWTFNQFVQQQSVGQVSLGAAQGQRIQYWDPNGTYTLVREVTDVTIELQGTSTLENAVKNLNITIPNSTVFIPKSTWLPEQTYTLKSDVIDSSHSNNAAIGYFINTVLGDAAGKGANAFFPFNETAKSNVYNSAYVINQQPTATLKHTVEGFPIFLIMKFATDTTSTVSVTPLGIYSFNLGRDAFRNLGFKSITSIKVNGSDSVEVIDKFPYIQSDVIIEETDSDANWIEIDGTSQMDISGLGASLPADFDSSRGDFWQSADNILHNRYSVRFPAGRYPESYPNFKSLVSSIMELPVEGTSSTNVTGIVTRPQIASSYDLYTCDSNGDNYVKTGQSQQMSTNYDSFSTLGEVMNYDSFYKYFVIAMLFGLVDNFGKNSTYRSWGGGQYFIGFYDLDTALQNNNQGVLDIDPDTWFKYIYNKQDGDNEFGYMAETEDGTQGITKKVVSAYNNKLWLSLDTPTARAAFNLAGPSLYTSYWYALRTELHRVAVAAGYKDFVDYFVDEFFEKQAGECGALIFNYDYKLKYLLQFTNNSYEKNDDLSRLHGRKIASTREWLKKRVVFLDSIFRWRDASISYSGFPTNLFSSGNNNVYNTPAAFPIKTNTSLVMYHQVGNITQAYYFMKRNVATMVNTASNGPSIVSWNFSHSSNVIEMGDSLHPLSQMNIETLSHSETSSSWDRVGYPAVTSLDLSNSTNLGNKSPLASFHAGSADEDKTSELRVIDFSNTSGGQFSLVSDLVKTFEGQVATDFSKLTKIDIRNSKSVTDIAVPPVPLQELNVAGSTITSFELEGQAYLTNVNLSNCTTLQKVVLRDCASYGDFSISNLSGLTELTIALCPQMQSITINSCGALRKISIQNNVNLKSITITNCASLIGLSNDSNFLTITDCPSLITLNLFNNSNLKAFNIETSNEANITTLNLRGTKVTKILGGGNSNEPRVSTYTDQQVEYPICDLRNFKSLTNVNFNGNTDVQYIHFANENTAIPLVNTFGSCTSLKRIFGHVSVNVDGAFNGCRNFSIHGTTNIQFNGSNVRSTGINSGRWMMPYEVLGVEYTAFTGVGKQATAFTTNMDFGTTSLHQTFRNTQCTTFDVYYVFSNAPRVTTFTYTFAYIPSPFNWSASVDNSPNRHMLRWATSLVSMHSCFYGVTGTTGYIRLFSPTRNGSVINTDGFFSGVTGTLTTIYRAFLPWSIITDRFLFRHPTSNFTSLQDIGYLNIVLLHDDANTGTYSQLIPYTSSTSRKGIQSMLSGTYTNIGNWTGFFDQLTSLTAIKSVATNSAYINFDTLRNIPASVTRITLSFRTMYGSGTMNLGFFLANKSTLQSVMGSFIVSYRYAASLTSEIRVEMPLTDNYFSGFTSLVGVGNPQGSGQDWDSYDDSGNTSVLSSSFMGYGIHKYIDQETFPNNILVPCMDKIQVFSGFFSGLESEEGSSFTGIPEFPGKVFYDPSRAVNAVNLLRAGALFFNVNIPYTLSSEGFTASTKLSDVSYMFAADTSVQFPDSASTTQSAAVRKNYGQGYIPANLFYHGEGTAKTVTYYGINGTVEDVIGGYKVTPTGSSAVYMKVSGNTVSWYSDTAMKTAATSPVLTQTFSLRNVNRSIANISNCFLRANFSAYNRELAGDSTDYEANEKFQPFDWVLDGTSWLSGTSTKNTYPYTDMWLFDGDPDHKTTESGVENLDVTNFTVPQIPHPVAGDTGGTKNFMCAPDLLRYCQSSCNVTKLFAYSGHNNHDGSRGNTFSQSRVEGTYGIKGRIVPWLLYSLKKASSVNLTGMFIDCKMLSSYKSNTEGSSVYLIPEDLFAWCPNVSSLQETFSGLVFPSGISLDVFSNIPAAKLTTVRNAFWRPLFTGTTTIADVFDKFTVLSDIYGVFAISTAVRENGAFIYNQSVTFSKVFKQNTYNISSAYSSNNNFMYAFAGYTNASFGTKTLITSNDRHNYMPYNGETTA